MLSELPPFALVLLAIGGMAVFWFSSRELFAWASGWESLSSWFHVDQLPHGENFRFASGAMGRPSLSVKYRKSLGVTVTPAGLGLSMLSLFGRTPSLFIPWTKVESLVHSKVFFTKAAVVHVRGQWPVIWVYGPPGEALALAYEESLSKRAL
jgi:hypothetical protein